MNKKLIKKYIGISSDIELEGFIKQAKRYIKATKEQRIICSIDSVSHSGMSRTLKFLEMPKNGGYLYDFYYLFNKLGFSKVRDSDCFRITGGGMDMVFHTHYTIIHNLQSMGFITRKTCDVLAQKTPQTI